MGLVEQMKPCNRHLYTDSNRSCSRTDRCPVYALCSDSHSKTLYRALQCFLFDFWDHHECRVSTQPDDVAALLHQPAADGISNCFHLTGAGGGRVCMIHVVLATNLINNTQVNDQVTAVSDTSAFLLGVSSSRQSYFCPQLLLTVSQQLGGCAFWGS